MEGVLERYQRGLSSYNNGVAHLEQAIQYESFSEAEAAARESLPDFSDAIPEFSAAAELAAEIDETQATRLCRNAERKSSLMTEAAELYADSSAAYDAGRRREGMELRQRFHERRRSADELELVSSRQLARSLGMSS